MKFCIQSWTSAAVLYSRLFICERNGSWRSVSQHSHFGPSKNSAIKSFILKHCEFGWNASPAGWCELGFLWLQERKWTSEPNHYLLEEGADSDTNSKDAAALVKVCFHFVSPACKVWSMPGISALDTGRNRASPKPFSAQVLVLKVK